MSRDLARGDLGELGCLGIAKSQIPNTKSQGFRCRVSGKRKMGAETQNFASAFGGLFVWSTHFPPQPALVF